VGLTLVERAYDALMPNPPGVADFAGVKRIALGLIDPHPEQPRRGELPEIPELAENVRRYGLLQPIVVAPPVGGRYQLIAGARRLAAFRHLLAQEQPGPDPAPVAHPQPSPWAAIPAFVRDAGTLDRLLLALSENLARRDLSDADTVLAVRTLHDMHAWTATEIAARVGTSVGWISQVLGVARDPELADHVQAGRLSVAKAHEVRTAKDPARRGAALAVALRGGSQPAIRRAKQPAALRYLSPPDAPPADTVGPDSGLRYLSPPGAAPAADPTAAAGLRYLDPPDQPPRRDDRPGDGAEAPSGARRPGPEPSSARTEAQLLPEPVATVIPTAAARDLADVARELGLTGRLADLQSTILFAAALRGNLATYDVGAMLRAMREDLRRLESLVRAAQLGQHGRPTGT
jgi:ParB family chromosome partitioning protein